MVKLLLLFRILILCLAPGAIGEAQDVQVKEMRQDVASLTASAKRLVLFSFKKDID